MDRVIRVLVVDDSAFIRKVVKQMLSRSPFLEVVGTAHDGNEALELVEQLRPDVVTLDLNMPGLDGLGFLRRQMPTRPVPVVVCSIAGQSGEQALQALDAGAIDFVQKPTALATDHVYEMADELIAKVKAAASATLRPLGQPGPPPALVRLSSAGRARGTVDVVVLGISTGGPHALKQVIPQLPADLPVPLAIVQHMPVGYTELYARSLNALSAVEVREARDGEALAPGCVLLAQAGRHLSFFRTAAGDVVTRLDTRPFDTPHRPSVDVLFRSAADVFGARVLGVVMTGMGSDGTQGAAWIKAQGGQVFTEAEETCVVYGMPRSVVEAGLSDRSAPLPDMAQAILEVL